MEPLHRAADVEDLLSLFDQYSNLMSSNSDCLATDNAVFINEVSVEGISAAYHVTVHQCVTTALFNTGANILVISQKYNYHKAETAKIKYMYSNRELH